MTTIVGIDLGTTHTVAAYGDALGDIHILPIPQLVSRGAIEARELLPSVLYAPTSGEGLSDPFADAPYIEGELARTRAAEIPGRAVLSAKSWLSHSGIDRTAPILPWDASEDVVDLPRISPLDASARYLTRVARSLAAAKITADLVVLTVPASFDETARELTLQAAEKAGLRVRLLEEPQAAFYDVMRRIGDRGLSDLIDRINGEARILVCDVGGGTTDLSLLRVSRDPDIRVERIAVGRHLLLGGDNMDLALAALVEERLGQKLDATRFSQLVALCRNAKEALLGADPPATFPIRLLASGAKLVGATLSSELTAEDAARVLVSGFFPLFSSSELAAQKPARSSAIVSLGLPYERDAAITKHVAAFLTRHAAAHPPNALLLNGGVFHSPRLAARIADQVEACVGTRPVAIENDAPDLAVARGAVAYGQAISRHDRRSLNAPRLIEGGAARGYYMGVDASHAICVLPRGADEATPYVAEGRVFALTIGKPARFEIYACDDAADEAGAVVEIDPDRFVRLPPLATRLGDAGRTREIRVVLSAELTAVGTLELFAVEKSQDPRRFRLSFHLRGTENDPVLSTRPPPSLKTGALDDAKKMIRDAFEDKADRKVKDLLRDLERRMGERASWPLESARALFDEIAPMQASRRLSADHERVFWLLAGYCVRPGFGAAGDGDRARLFSRLFVEKVVFAENPRVWQQFFIAMRRASGGIDETSQTAMRDAFDPILAPSEAGLKRSKKWKPLSEDDLLETAASLERVSALRRAELGDWILERTWMSRDPRLWTAVSKLGSRAPAYASVHHVVATKTAEKWLDQLLKEKWENLQTAELSAVRLARKTGDRVRDIDDRLRGEVEKRLIALDARPESIRAVRELVVIDDTERATFFGEALPAGLRLA